MRDGSLDWWLQPFDKRLIHCLRRAIFITRTTMADHEEHIRRLFAAELQFRLASAVRLAVQVTSGEEFVG